MFVVYNSLTPISHYLCNLEFITKRALNPLKNNVFYKSQNYPSLSFWSTTVVSLSVCFVCIAEAYNCLVVILVWNRLRLFHSANFFFHHNFFVISDPRSYHCLVPGRGVYRSAWSAWDLAEVHRTSDHNPHCGPDWSVWVPGCRREGWETLGHSYAVRTHSWKEMHIYICYKTLVNVTKHSLPFCTSVLYVQIMIQVNLMTVW